MSFLTSVEVGFWRYLLPQAMRPFECIWEIIIDGAIAVSLA